MFDLLYNITATKYEKPNFVDFVKKERREFDFLMPFPKIL